MTISITLLRSYMSAHPVQQTYITNQVTMAPGAIYFHGAKHDPAIGDDLLSYNGLRRENMIFPLSNVLEITIDKKLECVYRKESIVLFTTQKDVIDETDSEDDTEDATEDNTEDNT